ncbi:MAG: 50S ribosomal protein L20 [Chlamydiae bacterium RIFCSPHIGHO2_12_FULL_27_8]|nr:MAG: 50S ribosomal protein L20 [Chlamydiae bacterium RIFCSPHIGHO2_12_FULL_27_8]OGN65785.1 MAG: 50S ribosomal protein L20 [Chlamydiae bacterium RIFCSPLOWO2_01_FULL_28_7]
MSRATCAVSSRERRKRVLKLAKGFYGDRKNHIRLTKDAVMKALAYNYIHRKQKKRNFRSLWITRISIAAKINGISYSKLLCGLTRAKCLINRKILAELAMSEPATFTVIVNEAKKALIA